MTQAALRPKAWTVILAWAVTFSAANIISLTALVVYGALEEGISADTVSRWSWPILVRAFADDIRRPPVAVALFALAAVTYGVSALICGLAGDAPLGRALNTRRVSWGALLVASLGLIGAGDVLDSLVKAYQLDHYSGFISRLSFVVEQLTGTTLVAGVLVFGLLGSLCTELFFRGYAQSRLSARWGPVAGVVIAATLSSTLAFGDPIETPCLFLIGLALGWVTVQTGSVWPAVLAHAARTSFFVLDTAGFVRLGLSPGWRYSAMLVLAMSGFVLLLPDQIWHRSRRSA